MAKSKQRPKFLIKVFKITSRVTYFLLKYSSLLAKVKINNFFTLQISNTVHEIPVMGFLVQGFLA